MNYRELTEQIKYIKGLEGKETVAKEKLQRTGCCCC